MLFTQEIKGVMDRITVGNFDSIAIYNTTADSGNVQCKRTLTHRSDRSGYHFYYVTLLNAWGGGTTNDNVAMGGGCASDDRDFISCANASTNAESYYDLCGRYTGAIAGSFDSRSSNIEVDTMYTNYEWTYRMASLDDHPAKRLSYYVLGWYGDYWYEDNIGYDTLITSSIGKALHDNNFVNDHLISKIQCFPNPFRRQINLDVSDQATAEIFDIRGNKIAQFKGNAIWKPNQDTPNGVYLVKTLDENGLANLKRIHYMR